jgi:hypothetical protein
MTEMIKLEDIKNLRGKDRIRNEILDLVNKEKLDVHEVEEQWIA